jgi:hypothetical protein
MSREQAAAMIARAKSQTSMSTNEKFMPQASQDKRIYDAETGMYFENDFALQNSKKVREHLKKQKPVSREEAIAQIQRIRQASSRTKNSQNDEGRVFNDGKVSQ